MGQAYDIAVIGAGAAGLAAGIAAAETNPGLRIGLLDGARKIGAKILVAGGTRCNVTHQKVSPSDYNGDRRFIRHVLAAFDERAATRWIESLGVRLKVEETGKIFPISDSGAEVLDALVRRCGELGVVIHCGCRVNHIVKSSTDDHGFEVEHSEGVLHARRLILATGGRSLPKTGSDGQGWQMAMALGHSVTPTYPALVPLVLRSDWIHQELSGLSTEVCLSTFADAKLIDRRMGDRKSVV